MLKRTDRLLDWFCARIPVPPKNIKGGRPRTDRRKRKALAGGFRLLDNGGRCKDLPRQFGSKSAGHRFFQRLVREGVLERLLQEAGQLVEEHGEYRLYECFPDAAFCPARGGGDGIGRTKVGKGVKILIAVEARGLPIAVQSCSARPHESTLAQGWFDFMLTKEVPKRLVGEKAWESDALDRAFAARGMELIAPHRSSRRPENRTQDGRSLRRYRRRWVVERTVARLLHFRRLCIRWEQSSRAFEAYLQMACAFLLVRQVPG